MSIGTDSLTGLMAELSDLIERGTAALVSGQRLAGPAAPQDSPAELVPDPVHGSVGVGLVYGDDSVIAIALARPFAAELAGEPTPEAVQAALGDLLGALATGRPVEATQVVGLESDADLVAFLGGRPGLVGAGVFQGDAVVATFGAAASAMWDTPAAATETADSPTGGAEINPNAPAGFEVDAPLPAPAPSATPTAAPAAASDLAAAPSHHVQAQAPVAAQPAPLGADRLARGLAMLADVHLEVTAELGRTKLRVSELLSLEPGSVIGLDREAGSPVDLLVNGTLFARAEVIVADNQYAVRITELVGGGVAQ